MVILPDSFEPQERIWNRLENYIPPVMEKLNLQSVIGLFTQTQGQLQKIQDNLDTHLLVGGVTSAMIKLANYWDWSRLIG